MNFITRRLMYFDTYAVTAFFVCFSAVEIFILEGEYMSIFLTALLIRVFTVPQMQEKKKNKHYLTALGSSKSSVSPAHSILML